MKKILLLTMPAAYMYGMDGQNQQLNDKKKELKKAWGFLQMVKAKSNSLPPLYANQQYHIAQQRIDAIKKELPDGDGDAIIKKLQEK